MEQWSLDSNNGWCGFRARIQGSYQDSERRCHVVKFAIRGRSWDRTRILEEEGYALVDEFSIRLPQLIVPHCGIERLYQSVTNWLGDYANFETRLVDESDQKLIIGVKARRLSLSKVPKPLCTVTYAVSGARGSASFIVDETCLWRMGTELKAVLASKEM